MVDVSLFCSAVRPALWPSLFNSLKGTSCSYEAVFAGNNRHGCSFEFLCRWWATNYDILKYKDTENIKPAQCYEIARRACTGEVVVWIADDCEFPNDVIGKAFKYWKSQANEKLILSLQTKESGYNLPKGELFDMNLHRFFGSDLKTPLMAPIGMMSRKFLEELGGFDRRFISGQYENFCIMMAYERGGTVQIFGDKNTYVDIDHLGKSYLIGESKTEEEFLKRPFASSYQHDRRILENSWTTFDIRKANEILSKEKYDIRLGSLRDISKTQLDKFEPYSKDISLTKSEGPSGKWE